MSYQFDEIAFRQRLEDDAEFTTRAMDTLLPKDEGPEGVLMEAVRYSALMGGKRARPYLTLNTAQLFNVDPKCALRAAAAIEMVHCYSLIHDDLPAMDDDDLRRGQPTCHIQYDEATAILAGDALLTRAFEILSEEGTHQDANVRIALVNELSKAAGAFGMVGGQMLDLVAHQHELDMSEIARLQRMKTGALINFACIGGAILGKASESALGKLHGYAHDLGLAFQIVDDLLDVTGTEQDLGKRTGKDEEQGKATFVSLLGLENAREQAQLLRDQAIEHLETFGDKADPLRDMAHFVVNRVS
ncbi:farnesyl diphosphate synthase [Magnetovibrio sp. PR-2]|uniref:polyprenyl synthetase family protein n=1 Tax=Magnetovibrio sp. PR-2 TaxID=3120356 RepID=UPI002FCDEF07